MARRWVVSAVVGGDEKRESIRRDDGGTPLPILAYVASSDWLLIRGRAKLS